MTSLMISMFGGCPDVHPPFVSTVAVPVASHVLAAEIVVPALQIMSSEGRADRSTSVQHPQRAVLGPDDLVALGLRHPSPHPVGLTDGERVRTALLDDRAALADLLGAGLPTGAGRATLVLRVEEQGAVHL